MILEIKNFSAAFRREDGSENKAVDLLNLKIAEGSFASIVGESGSGKSVTALSITRLIPAAALTGEILFKNGREQLNTLSLSAEKLLDLRGKKIAYIFQDPGTSLNPVLTIGSQLVETRRAHFDDSKKNASEKALKSLSDVKIKDAARVFSAYPHELSGGMKQRVMIAMALIAEPKLLIADEPTTALDVATEKDILDLLVNAKKEKGLSIVFITHNLSLAAAYSDAVYVMQKGRVVECLGPKSQAQHPYTRKLFAARLENVAPKTFIGV